MDDREYIKELEGRCYAAVQKIERLSAEVRIAFEAGYAAAVDEWAQEEIHIKDINQAMRDAWNCRKWADENPAATSQEQDERVTKTKTESNPQRRSSG